MVRNTADGRLKIKRHEPLPFPPEIEDDGIPPACSFEELFSVQRLKRTWRVLRREIREIVARDAIDWIDWSLSIDQALQQISAEVIAGTYVPQPPTRFEAAIPATHESRSASASKCSSTPKGSDRSKRE